MVGLISAALSLSLMVTAAPPRPAVRNATFVTTPSGTSVAVKHVRKAALMRQYKNAARTGVNNGNHAPSSPQANASGCYEVTPSFALVPCKPR